MKKHYAWIILLGGIITSGIALTFTAMLTPLFVVPVTQEFGIGRAEFAINTSIVSLCGCVMQVVIGKIYTKYKIKKFQVGSLVLLGLVFLARGLTQNIFQQYVCSFVAGFLTAPVALGNSTMITRWFQKSRGTAISMIFAGQSLVTAIMSPIVSNIIAGAGWRTAYTVLGIIVLVIAAPIALFVMRQEPADMGLQPYGAGEVAAGGPGKRPPAPGADYTFSRAKGKPFFYLFVLGAVCAGLIGNSGAQSQIVPFLTDTYSATLAASYISAGSVVGIVGKLLVGWINDKFGIRVALVVGFVSTAVFFGLLFAAGSMPVFYLIVLIFGIVGSVGSVTATMLAIDTFGPKNFSLFSGMMQSINFVGGAAGGYLAALAFDTFRSYKVTWAAAAVLALVTLACYITSNRLSKAEQTARADSGAPGAA